MDLRQGSKASLLIQLSTGHGLQVGADIGQWQFSAPLALDNDANGMDTRIKLTALADQVSYKGSRSFRCKRLSLADVKRNVSTTPPTPWSGNAPATTYDCLAYFRRAYGIAWGQDDVQDLPVTDNGDGTYQVTLTAKPGSILWLGTCQLNTGKLPDISRAASPSFEWSAT